MPAMGLGRPFYKPNVDKMSTKKALGSSWIEKKGELATVAASPRAHARWRAEAASGWRGAAKSGQAEAVQGTAALQVRRVGVEMAWESHSRGGELAGFEMQRRRGRRVLWAAWQGRIEGAWRWVGSGRCRGGQVAVQRRRARLVGGNPRRRRPAAVEQSSGGAGGRRKVGGSCLEFVKTPGTSL